MSRSGPWVSRLSSTPYLTKAACETWSLEYFRQTQIHRYLLCQGFPDHVSILLGAQVQDITQGQWIVIESCSWDFVVMSKKECTHVIKHVSTSTEILVQDLAFSYRVVKTEKYKDAAPGLFVSNTPHQPLTTETTICKYFIYSRTSSSFSYQFSLITVLPSPSTVPIHGPPQWLLRQRWETSRSTVFRFSIGKLGCRAILQSFCCTASLPRLISESLSLTSWRKP